MSNKIVIGGVALLFVVGIIVILCSMQEDQLRLKAENDDLKDKNNKLETDKLKLIKDSLQRNDDVSEIIKEQLFDLASQFQKLSPKIARQIHKALEMIQLGRKEDAIADLVIIMENLLEHRYEHHTGYINWLSKKQKTFQSYLEYCFREDKKIGEPEYRFYVATKAIRNKASHELDPTLDDDVNNLGILSAISGITKLGSLAYPN